MNSNKRRISKDTSLDLKENYSLNNWMRVLNTSGMSVIDRLILDNHRRQILKNLSNNESFTEDSFDRKPSKTGTSTVSKPFCTFQQINNSRCEGDTSKQRVQYRTLNDSFLTNESKSMCADRLYNDAVVRQIKLQRAQEIKEEQELEKARDFANLHHPQRKPDQEVMNRLLQEEKIIKSLYDVAAEPEEMGRSRRFSCEEQKNSVERLTRCRGKSVCKEESKENLKRLMPGDIDNLVKRLYKVKEYPRPVSRDILHRKERERVKEQQRENVTDTEKISEKNKDKSKEKNGRKDRERERERLSKNCGKYKKENNGENCGREENRLEIEILNNNRKKESDYAREKIKATIDKKNSKREINFDGNISNELKQSTRYIENPDKSLETLNESIIEFSSNSFLSKSNNFEGESMIVNMLSPKCKTIRLTEDPHLEVKLLNCDPLLVSPMVSEIIQGSPESNMENPCIDNSFISFTTTHNHTEKLKIDESFEKEEYLERSPDIGLEAALDNYLSQPSNRESFEINKNTIERNEKEELQAIQVEKGKEKEKEKEIEKNSENGKEIHILVSGEYAEDSDNINVNDKTLPKTCICGSSVRGTKEEITLHRKLHIPKSMFLEPEASSLAGSTNYSQESLYLMQNPLHSLNSNVNSPKLSYKSGLDSYRFIIGITEDDEFIYAE